MEDWRSDGASELVIVDNGSGDGSVDRVRARYPDLEVVVPGSNLGYGAAANRGVAATTAPLVAGVQPRPRGAARDPRRSGRRRWPTIPAGPWSDP